MKYLSRILMAAIILCGMSQVHPLAPRLEPHHEVPRVARMLNNRIYHVLSFL